MKPIGRSAAALLGPWAVMMVAHRRAPRAAARSCVCAAVAQLCAGMAFAQLPQPDKIVIVVEENHAYEEIIGSPEAPYMNELVQHGALLTSFYAITHPSQPNYLQFFSGSNQGVTNNTAPAPGSPFSTPNLGAGVIAAGATFVGYCEDLPAVGSTVAISGSYYRKHNPWVNWQSATPGPNQLPPEVNQPFSAFPTDYSLLPDVSIVVPNQLNDMHDGTIAQADAWLEANIGPYAAWATTHNSLLIVTWDEDGSASRNRIATIFHGPMVAPGASVSSTWTLHNLLRTLEDIYGASHAGSAAQCRPIIGPFASDAPAQTLSFQEGVSGYAAAQDTFIESALPATGHATDVQLICDGSPVRDGLIRFDDIFGPGNGRIPPHAAVASAKLLILTGPASGSSSSVNTMSLHRMLTPWSETDTWNSLVAGVSTDDIEAASIADFVLIPNVDDAWAIFDVSDAVQSWIDNPGTNQGWLIQPAGTDGWRWQSSEFATAADRPRLEVVFRACAPCDMNCDGTVNPFDIQPFVNLLSPSPPAPCSACAADANLDGTVNPFDINAFLTCMGG